MRPRVSLQQSLRTGVPSTEEAAETVYRPKRSGGVWSQPAFEQVGHAKGGDVRVEVGAIQPRALHAHNAEHITPLAVGQGEGAGERFFGLPAGLKVSPTNGATASTHCGSPTG